MRRQPNKEKQHQR